ncbi:DNA repair protein RadC [Neoasaia chiangmaiensis NBRC 101099]|nr:JAB domain-containing protein [Neoasaia chiangmaiensis]GBR37627.1 DNA repair protein RadC [Neoasaia chiangmaiensis NBRC 101099]GEN15042.1 UPF0758 protein R01728 [Neoasaia chiangmaiensis]
MRARILANGASSLADYELLEMLLFFGIPRRDTKPMAKALLQRFGTLLDVFRATRHALGEMGLSEDAIRAIRLPAIAAERLSGAETRIRPGLGNWAQLSAYVDIALLGAVKGQLRILFLDNRNRLIADEPVVVADGPSPVLRRALTLNATALIGLAYMPQAPLAWARDHAIAIRDLEDGARVLSIALHDVMVAGEGEPISLRQEGLL